LFVIKCARLLYSSAEKVTIYYHTEG